MKRAIERVPGGMMLVPLFTGAAIATFWPGIGQYFGSFTGALFSGALPILAVFYVCLGSTIEIRATPAIMRPCVARCSFGVGTTRWSHGLATATRAQDPDQGRARVVPDAARAAVPPR